jgi:hypothetical protein
MLSLLTTVAWPEIPREKKTANDKYFAMETAVSRFLTRPFLAFVVGIASFSGREIINLPNYMIFH